VKAAAESLSQKVTKATTATANAKAENAKADNAKADEERKLIAQLKVDRYKGRMTRGMAHGAADRAAETAKAKPKKEVLNAAVKTEKPAVVGKYSVNMLSYQQEWFAQSKAAEFKQKGIPVEVVPTDPTKPGTSFRLKVGGFKTKSEADAYSDKVKKSLDLKETWVGSTNN
jgi:cellobiose-specific phosphotransferase system component IIB